MENKILLKMQLAFSLLSSPRDLMAAVAKTLQNTEEETSFNTIFYVASEAGRESYFSFESSSWLLSVFMVIE
jgi:hypothetical protein